MTVTTSRSSAAKHRTRRRTAGAASSSSAMMSSALSRALQRLVNHLISLVRSCLACLASWWARAGQKPLLLDTGRRVYVGRRLAEGGFSYVFEAYDADAGGGGGGARSRHDPPYVLKRVHGDAEVLDACRREARVHRTVLAGADARHNPNVMPLLGLLLAPDRACFLFPYFPTSLRSEIQRRVAAAAAQVSGSAAAAASLPIRSSSSSLPPCFVSAPWSELELLELFWGILCGARALHDHKFSHRDIKVDNVLLAPPAEGPPPHRGGRPLPPQHQHQQQHDPPQRQRHYTPVLMDFGSAGPLSESIRSRRDQLEAAERASTHTTVSYRPPELFEGGVRAGDTLDYEKVDVWGLGCTLFAASYGQGASPSECEFVRGPRPGGAAVVRVVECTHLKVLAGLPPNPPPWYSPGLWSLLEDMLHQDPARRPTLPAVMERVRELIRQAGGGGGGADDFGASSGSPAESHDRQFAVRPAAGDDDDEDVELATRFL